MESQNPLKKPTPRKRGQAKYPMERELARFLWEKTSIPEKKICEYTRMSAGLIHKWRTTDGWNGSHRRQGTQNDPLEKYRSEIESLKIENERLRQELVKYGSDPDDIEQLMILTRKRMAQLAPMNDKLSDLAAMHRELRETLKSATQSENEEQVSIYLPEIVEDYEPEPANEGEIAA